MICDLCSPLGVAVARLQTVEGGISILCCTLHLDECLDLADAGVWPEPGALTFLT